MAHTKDDVLTIVDLYPPGDIQDRLRFLVEMKNKGIASDVYKGNQVVFRSAADLQEEIRLYRAAWLCATTGGAPQPTTRAFRILDGWGLRNEGDER